MRRPHEARGCSFAARRIHARHHRPENFLHVGRIDVFVDDNDVAAVAIGRGTAEGRRTRLLGMAGVFLLDRNNGQVRSVIVHADDVLNAGAFQLIPEHARGNMQIHFYRAGPERRFIFENRIVAVINRFDPNDRLIFSRAARTAGIITRPLAERSFGSRFFSRWRDLAFDGDFR